MKDLDEASDILDTKIYINRSKRMLGLFQSQYIDLVLKRFNMKLSKRGYMLVSHGIRLFKKMCLKTPEERKRMSEISYASAMYSIMYTMLYTRPDVTYALGIASRFQIDPREDH